jgi:glycosyltransferase involved in cell wall biosynthesis
MKPYLMVSGDFVRTGGMDVANYWLARHLADRGHEVHLVAHRIAGDLAKRENIRFHRIIKPLGSSLLGEPLLDRAGRHWADFVARRGGKVLANGGNCGSKGTNWVHYVHAAYQPIVKGSPARRLKSIVERGLYLAHERRALLKSKLIIANSARTRSDVVTRLAVRPDRVRTVYYGADPEAFHPHSRDAQERSRAKLGVPEGGPVVLFVGSIADDRKGFSTLLEAWRRLCADPGWDAQLAVAGTVSKMGSKIPDSHAAIRPPIHFLGFRYDIPQVLAACDLLVSPARYEAYGLAVHEALCSGVPAFVSAKAGVAEQYPATLQHLLLPNPEDAADISDRLRQWRKCIDQYRAATSELSRQLRSRTWDHACAEMVELIEAAG